MDRRRTESRWLVASRRRIKEDTGKFWRVEGGNGEKEIATRREGKLICVGKEGVDDGDGGVGLVDNKRKTVNARCVTTSTT